MRLLLKCVCSNEHLEGYGYAVLDLTPDIAGVILQRVELLQMLLAPSLEIRGKLGSRELFAMHYHDVSAQWLNDEPSMDDGLFLIMADPRATNGDGEFIELPDDFRIPETWHAASEGDYMVIRNYGTSEPRIEVCWVCRPKHSDDHCETADIDIDTLKIAARGGLLGHVERQGERMVADVDHRTTDERFDRVAQAARSIPGRTVETPMGRFCVDVRCGLPGDHEGPCVEDEPEDRDEDNTANLGLEGRG